MEPEILDTQHTCNLRISINADGLNLSQEMPGMDDRDFIHIDRRDVAAFLMLVQQVTAKADWVDA